MQNKKLAAFSLAAAMGASGVATAAMPSYETEVDRHTVVNSTGQRGVNVMTTGLTERPQFAHIECAVVDPMVESFQKTRAGADLVHGSMRRTVEQVAPKLGARETARSVQGLEGHFLSVMKSVREVCVRDGAPTVTPETSKIVKTLQSLDR
jgi:hypothetical protein